MQPGSSWIELTSSSPPSIANRRRSSCIGTYGRLLMKRRSCGAVQGEPRSAPFWPGWPFWPWLSVSGRAGRSGRWARSGRGWPFWPLGRCGAPEPLLASLAVLAHRASVARRRRSAGAAVWRAPCVAGAARAWGRAVGVGQRTPRSSGPAEPARSAAARSSGGPAWTGACARRHGPARFAVDRDVGRRRGRRTRSRARGRVACWSAATGRRRDLARTAFGRPVRAWSGGRRPDAGRRGGRDRDGACGRGAGS